MTRPAANAKTSPDRLAPDVRARATASIRATALRRADTARSRVTADRVALGLTGSDLARLAGLLPFQVSFLETGHDSPCAVNGEWRPTAIALAKALGSTPADLWPEHAPRVPRLPRPEAPARPDDLYFAAETAARVTAAVAQLPAPQAYAVACRFGLEGNDERTLLEVGDGLGLSRERARQIETEALARLATLLGDLRP